jgi:glycosyltransferase involved in cell wall biosynthesis
MGSTVRIVSVGPALCVQGGVSRVISLIADHLPARFRFRHVATFDRFTGDQGATDSERGTRVGQALIFALAALRILVRAFARNTIFHVHFAGGGSLLRKGMLCILLRILRCQYVVHSHAADPEIFQPWVPAFVRRSILWGLRGAAYVIVLTQFWRQYYAGLLGLPESRIVVLPNPADLPATVPDRSGRPQVSMLFLGRIGVRKGAFDVIRALAALPADVRPNCRLIMAGDGEIEEARALAAELGCSSLVSLVGWVQADAVNRLLSEADVLLLPSHAEGMAMALVEAMSWQLPVITTGVCGASEFLDHRTNCLLVSPGDIPAISAAMNELARTPAFRHQLGCAARETISRFSVDSYTTRLAGLYDDLATRSYMSTAVVSRAADPARSRQS